MLLRRAGLTASAGLSCLVKRSFSILVPSHSMLKIVWHSGLLAFHILPYKPLTFCYPSFCNLVGKFISSSFNFFSFKLVSNLTTSTIQQLKSIKDSKKKVKHQCLIQRFAKNGVNCTYRVTSRRYRQCCVLSTFNNSDSRGRNEVRMSDGSSCTQNQSHLLHWFKLHSHQHASTTCPTLTTNPSSTKSPSNHFFLQLVKKK